MSWWQFLLFPFAIIYDLITRSRNWCYDRGIFKSHHFPELKIISVGNLSVGGTGKTPMVEYLVDWAIANRKKTIILSRGYGRKTNGVRIAQIDDTPNIIGDEPCGYLKKFGSNIQVVVAEKRVEGVKTILSQFPETELVILDDAFQHRSLKSDFSILLTTQKRPFWSDYVLPSGRLREARKGFKQANLLVVTKSTGKDSAIPENINFLNSQIKYGHPVFLNGELNGSVMAVSGLADNSVFFDYVRATFNNVDQRAFPDHHSFSKQEVEELVKQVGNGTLLCTQKDAVKLEGFEEMKLINWGYIPITLDFFGDENRLEIELKKVLND